MSTRVHDGVGGESKTRAKNANKIWLAVQRLMNEHGRGGEWYKHVEFNVKVISQMTELSPSCVRSYLDQFVESGNLAKYENAGTANIYMWEIYYS